MLVKKLIAAVAGISIFAACQGGGVFDRPNTPQTLADVPAVRLNFRFEPDVPAPTVPAEVAEERNAAIQADFDNARPHEILDRTIASPDKKRVLAVYHRVSDVQAEFRLDMYTIDGRLLKKVTPDTMAVHFPDTIVWAPDSSAVAFVGMLRIAPTSPTPEGDAVPGAAPQPDIETNTNTAGDGNPEANADEALPPAQPTPAAPSGILTFRTEQIYICNAEGDGTKAVTENEGLIYFYYVWSPDSTMLAALAATVREWQYLSYQAETKGEAHIPQGRPRIVEKNGRERRLDDALTSVHPVWSSDSSKVADAFETQIRIYDAGGNNPTQAAIPLRNQLLLSSQAYDRDQALKLEAANGATPPPAPAAGQADSLPDPQSLVSFNPITDLEWTSPDLLYLRTAFIKRMKNDADSVQSFARWHRLVFTPQARVSNQ